MTKTTKHPEKKAGLVRYEDVADEVSLEIRDRAEKRAQEIIEANLVEFRQLAGITQAELARRLQATQGHVSKTETKNDPKISVLRRHVEALGGQLRLEAVVGDLRVLLTI